MKRIMFSVLCISSLLMAISCKNDEKAIDNKEQAISTRELVFEIEGIFPKNDKFQLFYSNDNNFSEDKSLFVTVYGQSILQKIVFELPEGIKPQNFRLDLGSNADQQEISIKEISITYKGQSESFIDEEFLEIFPETSTVNYDKSRLVYKLVPNVDGIFDPIIVSNDNLKKSLNKLYNTSN